MMRDNPSQPMDPQTAANYFQTLENNIARSDKVNSMIVDVVKSGGVFTVTISLNGSISYMRSGIALQNLGAFDVQSHWGSGVVFSNMQTTAY
ncbi:hypothetical protein Pla175_24710 [Pirellulimonas nuda]|uniref:Uncharacterized protein n=2 Tax=Pirellulimonas nuda TaxID=2528009 RepID=A0A518DC87_9BACT|nr:hypothetical protein Pla175_24710 [Pirellulimonas nuda]